MDKANIFRKEKQNKHKKTKKATKNSLKMVSNNI